MFPLVLLGACAAREVTPAEPVVIASSPDPAPTPYAVEVLDGGGAVLETHEAGGRFYVVGEAGERYQIHVTNSTDARVEAVVTVDGLDVIDGEDGDLRKRGYVVPPHGDLTIEGFRTSTEEVATFRFSSVDESYAGRKGKARNVGVIAVALFAEAAPAEPVEIIVPDEAEETQLRAGAGGAARKRPAGYEVSNEQDGARPSDYLCCWKEETETGRPGLGTEYGEQRRSAATWTQFVRSSDTPIAVTELRYNDRASFASLPDGEITIRETADPYPGDPSFSRPPSR